MNPNTQPKPRKHFSLLRFFKRLFLVVCLLAVAFVALRFGPNLYALLFGGGNTTWISEHFGEELKAKNEMIVFETTITGQETASKEVYLIGEVQKVVVPYSYAIDFTVDLGKASVGVKPGQNVIEVRLPSPKATYHKLTVDEANMKKYDILYPLTPERYASIKAEIEQKLYDECSVKQEYLDSAWDSAVRNMESLFKSVAEQSEGGVTCTIEVVRDDTLTAESTATIEASEPTAAPAAA